MNNILQNKLIAIISISFISGFGTGYFTKKIKDNYTKFMKKPEINNEITKLL